MPERAGIMNFGKMQNFSKNILRFAEKTLAIYGILWYHTSWLRTAGTGVRHQPRYALMREVAAAPIGADGFFRGVCPILEPGERITNAKGYVRRCILRHGPISIVFAMYFSGGTAVRGSPDFLMRNY